jgi:hypothetical protein
VWPQRVLLGSDAVCLGCRSNDGACFLQAAEVLLSVGICSVLNSQSPESACCAVGNCVRTWLLGEPFSVPALSISNCQRMAFVGVPLSGIHDLAGQLHMRQSYNLTLALHMSLLSLLLTCKPHSVEQ